MEAVLFLPTLVRSHCNPSPSGLDLVHPAGGKVAPSNPSVMGTAAPTSSVTADEDWLLVALPSTAPFGAEVVATRLLIPFTRVMAGRLTFTVAFGARLPVHANAGCALPLTVRLMSAEVSAAEPKFLKVTTGVIAAAQTMLPFTGVTKADMPASLATGTSDWQPRDVSRVFLSELLLRAVSILVTWLPVNSSMQRSSA